MAFVALFALGFGVRPQEGLLDYKLTCSKNSANIYNSPSFAPPSRSPSHGNSTPLVFSHSHSGTMTTTFVSVRLLSLFPCRSTPRDRYPCCPRCRRRPLLCILGQNFLPLWSLVPLLWTS
ncbi:hypothetical protein F5888DRAFT_964610 [Russula emetica]|nr:hypothetical protein F5888DRAFT_964610 [Russula emetica]